MYFLIGGGGSDSTSVSRKYETVSDLYPKNGKKKGAAEAGAKAGNNWKQKYLGANANENLLFAVAKARGEKPADVDKARKLGKKTDKAYNKKHNGMTYKEANAIYNSIRNKYMYEKHGGYLHCWKPAENGFHLVSDEKGIEAVIKEYGTPEELEMYKQARDAREALGNEISQVTGRNPNDISQVEFGKPKQQDK